MYTDYTDEENSDGYSEYYNDDNSENGGNNIDKDKIKKIVIFVLAFVILVVVIIVIAKGCANKKQENNPSTNNTNLTPSIALGKESQSIEVGEEVTLYADVIYASVPNPVVTWQTDDSGIATVDDSGDGAAIIRGISEGETNIVALYTQDNRLYRNTCKVTVTSNVVNPENIDIVQDSITLSKDDKRLLQVKVTPDDAKVESFIFTSDDSNIASVDENGVVYALAVGTTTIKVTTADGMLSDTISVTVSPLEEVPTVINPTSIQLRGFTNGLTVGGTTKVVYDILPTNTTNKEINWSTTDPSIARISKNEDGVVVGGLKAGKTTIMATTSNGISASIEITVEANTIPVTGVTINGESSITMTVGGTKRLTYTVSPDNASNKKVKITSSDTSVVRVDSNGLVGALKAGTAIVTITTEDGEKTAIVTITVTGNGTITGSQTGNSGDSSSGGTSSGGTTGTLTDDSSGSSEESSGGSSDSSSGDSSSDDFSSSENQTNDATCNNSSMTTITHNGSGVGAIISQYSFNQAKAFSGKMTDVPRITLSKVSDCIQSLSYQVFYGSTSDKTDTFLSSKSISVNESIDLNYGNGYYIIVMTGKTKDSKFLKKNYYAIVERNGSSGTTTDSKNVSCNSSYFTYITHNGSSGTKVSSKSFNNATNFTISATPRITLSEVASCTKELKYTLYYGSSLSSLPPVKSNISIAKGGSISLDRGNGYYKIMLSGKDSNGTILRKYYYAIVQTQSSSSNSTITLSANATRNSLTKVITYTLNITSKNSEINSLKYCFGVSNCTPVTSMPQQITSSCKNGCSFKKGTFTGISTSTKKFCIKATNKAGKSTTKCSTID